MVSMRLLSGRCRGTTSARHAKGGRRGARRAVVVVVQTKRMDSTGDIGLHIQLVERVTLPAIGCSSLTLRLALVLKPNCHGFYFPILQRRVSYKSRC